MPKFTLNTSALAQLVDSTPTTLSINQNLTELTQISNLEVPDFSNSRQKIVPLLQNVSSLDCSLFVRILRKLILICNLNENQQYLNQIISYIVTLCNHNYDEEEVIIELKKSKDIDPVFVLALLWKLHKTQNTSQQSLLKILRVINLIVTSYPVDLILHGTPYLKTWNTYIKNKIISINKLSEIKNEINQLLSKNVQKSENGKSGKVSYNLITFTDIYIPL